MLSARLIAWQLNYHNTRQCHLAQHPALGGDEPAVYWTCTGICFAPSGSRASCLDAYLNQDGEPAGTGFVRAERFRGDAPVEPGWDTGEVVLKLLRKIF
jgi:hypothetical protein